MRPKDGCAVVSISVAVAPSQEREAVAVKEAVRRRRNAVQRVREARDRLTSTSGTTPAFDAELLRLFAQNRLSGSLVIILLVCSIGLVSGYWTGPIMAVTWTVAVLFIHFIILRKCRKFLAEPPGPQQIRAWRLRFFLLDLFFGLAWMFDLIQPIGVAESSGMFNLFMLLLLVAVSSMLASSLPIAVLALTTPVSIAVALNLLL